MRNCIDLKEQFGHRYRVIHEESYRAERGDSARVHDPWLLTIPCKFGHIYPHGGELLGASTDHDGRIANRLALLPRVRIIQDGDDGVNVVFHINELPNVASIMKPRRRRVLTAEQRNQRTERLRKYQFSSATQSAGRDRRRDAAPPPGSQAIKTSEVFFVPGIVLQSAHVVDA